MLKTWGNLFLVALAVQPLQAWALWETADLYTGAAASTTIVTSLAADSQGNVAAAISGGGSGDRANWVVRLKAADQTNFQTIDNYPASEGAYGITFDPSGALLASGLDFPPGASAPRMAVRKGVPGPSGWTWQTRLSWLPPTYGFSAGMRIAANAVGVHVSGRATDASAVIHWITQSSWDHGDSWALTDDYQLSPGKNSEAWDLALSASGQVAVVGDAIQADGSKVWVVRLGTPGASTVSWSTIDIYHPAGIDASASVAFWTSDGRLLVVGSETSSAGTSTRIRSTSDLGLHWDQADLLHAPLASYDYGRSLFADGSGTLYLVSLADISGVQSWIVRSSTDDARTWKLLETYLGENGKGGFSQTGVVDAFGDLFVGGGSKNADTGFTGAIRLFVP